jgi:hypothetical protein
MNINMADYLIKGETLTAMADKIREKSNTPTLTFTPKEMTNYMTGSGTHAIKLTNNSNDFFADSGGGYGKILYIKPDLTPGIISGVGTIPTFFDVYANSPIFIVWRNNNGYLINGSELGDFGRDQPFFKGFIATPTLEIKIENISGSGGNEPE